MAMRLFLVLMLFLLAEPLRAQELRLFSVGSGDVDGGYYAATRAICDIINRAERGRLRCSPESTPGSLYNLVALDNGQLDFALVQSDWQKHALKGTAFFRSRGPMRRLRSVMALYAEPFNLVVRREAGIAGIRGLAGKRVDLGQPSSGRQATMRAVMSWFSMTPTDFRLATELSGSQAINELCAGRIDATVLIAGHPNTAIARVLSECDAALVSLASPEIDRLVAESDDYSRFVVPAQTYAKLDAEVVTFAVRATVVTLSTMDDDIVEALVRHTLAHLELLRQNVPILATIDAQSMRGPGLSAPLHPAAARAFEKRPARN